MLLIFEEEVSLHKRKWSSFYMFTYC